MKFNGHNIFVVPPVKVFHHKLLKVKSKWGSSHVKVKFLFSCHELMKDGQVFEQRGAFHMNAATADSIRKVTFGIMGGSVAKGAVYSASMGGTVSLDPYALFVPMHGVPTDERVVGMVKELGMGYGVVKPNPAGLIIKGGV